MNVRSVTITDNSIWTRLHSNVYTYPASSRGIEWRGVSEKGEIRWKNLFHLGRLFSRGVDLAGIPSTTCEYRRVAEARDFPRIFEGESSGGFIRSYALYLGPRQLKRSIVKNIALNNRE